MFQRQAAILGESKVPGFASMYQQNNGVLH
jgi:hypothetical protein